jgi:hypothetical protein
MKFYIQEYILSLTSFISRVCYQLFVVSMIMVMVDRSCLGFVDEQ